MIVYVDVLIAINFIVDYLILYISGRLCGGKLNRMRVAAASLIGAFSSLSVLLPPLPEWFHILYKLALTALLAAVAGSFRGWRGYIKRILLLFVSSFVFSGMMFCVLLLFGSKAGFYQNGVYYFNISALELLAFAVIAYLVLAAAQNVFKKGMLSGDSYQVIVRYGGRKREFQGVMDSQNNLVDFFTGFPVIVGSQKLLKDFFPEINHSDWEDPMKLTGFRLIPCSTVTGESLLPAFHPDEVVIKERERERIFEDVYIAVSKELRGRGELLLNPAMSGRAKEQGSTKNRPDKSELFISK